MLNFYLKVQDKYNLFVGSYLHRTKKEILDPNIQKLKQYKEVKIFKTLKNN